MTISKKYDARQRNQLEVKIAPNKTKRRAPWLPRRLNHLKALMSL